MKSRWRHDLHPLTIQTNAVNSSHLQRIVPLTEVSSVRVLVVPKRGPRGCPGRSGQPPNLFVPGPDVDLDKNPLH